jgi:hypothetical protein
MIPRKRTLRAVTPDSINVTAVLIDNVPPRPHERDFTYPRFHKRYL